jgi:hypothetical protein
VIPAAAGVRTVQPGTMKGYTKEGGLGQEVTETSLADRQSNEKAIGRAHAAIISTIPSEQAAPGATLIVQQQGRGFRQPQEQDTHSIPKDHQFLWR